MAGGGQEPEIRKKEHEEDYTSIRNGQTHPDGQWELIYATQQEKENCSWIGYTVYTQTFLKNKAHCLET